VAASIECEVRWQSELHTHALHLVLHRAEGDGLVMLDADRQFGSGAASRLMNLS
jgi:hypothetical protein